MRLIPLVLCLSTSAVAGSGRAAAAAASVKGAKKDKKSKAKAKKVVEEEEPKKPAEPEPEKSEGPIHCKVGVYMLDVSGVDMKESVFNADFYLWMTWNSDAADSCDFELQNAESEERKESYKETKEQLHYIVWRIKAHLKGQFELQKYPFDTQLLPLHLESPGHAAREVVFEAEPLDAIAKALPFRGLDPKIRVPGWQIAKVDFGSSIHRYETRFGYPFGDENEQDYSRISYVLTVERLAWPYFLRAFLPLLIVVGCACLLFLLSWEKVDVAMGSAITALLAAIALHLVEAGALPSVGYLVALDKFFIWSYAIVLLISVEKVIAYRYGIRDRVATADRLDRISLLGIPALYVLGQAVILWSTLH
jgi:hypothetical protein